MSTIIGNAVTIGGGGAKLNIDYGATPPSDTTKLWVPLEKKPDAVECSPSLAFGGEIFATEQGAFGDNLAAEAQQNNVVGTKIYQAFGYYGGLTVETIGKLRWYDYQTKTTGETSLSQAYAGRRAACSVSVGGKIYVFGGVLRDGTVSYGITKIDAKTGNIDKTVSTAYSRSIGMFCTHKDGKIYFGGGYNGSSLSVGTLFSFDIATDTVTTIINSLPVIARYSSAIFVGDDLYIIGCNSQTVNTNSKVYKVNIQSKTAEEFLQLPGNYYSPAVACFDGRHIYVLGGTPTASVIAPSLKIDTVTKTYEQLSDNFNKYAFGVAYGIVGSKIYILGGCPSYQLAPVTNAVRSFTASSPLTSNHLFLQGDYGYDGLWTALKSKDTDFKVKVINAYLGDNNNIAQLTNAYLYDTASNQWKSLSGESYVADMQNALNILGVN